MHSTIKIMIKSKNFNFIKDQLPELATLADFAEGYIYSDPASCLVKLRSFVEQTVKITCKEMNIANPENTSLIDWMQNESFIEAVPKEVLGKLHSMRMNGNKAAHGQKISKVYADLILNGRKDDDQFGYAD